MKGAAAGEGDAEARGELDRAREELARCREGYAEIEAKWRSGAPYEPPRKDDLKKVEGIGPKIEGLLNAAGIYTWAQLAAADPASPYGAALPWPAGAAGRASRAAGAHVILVDGALAVFVERGGRRLLTFDVGETALQQAAAAFGDFAVRRLPRTTVETANGEPIEHTLLGRLLLEHGFATTYKGITLKGARARR